MSAPFVLGIVGASGSGKNTVADAVANLLDPDRITDVRLDDYHRYTREERAERGLTSLNPLVHNLPLMREHLQLLRQGRQIRNRSYSHSDGTFGPIRAIQARDVVLVRGLLGFPTPELHQLYDLSVFLQPEPDLLFRWKLRRDVLFRGYTETEVLKRIAHHLLDAKQYVLPQADHAHVLVRYELPDPDAPDAHVVTTMRLRREAGEIAGESDFLSGLPLECVAGAGGLEVRIPSGIPESDVDAWGRDRFPDTYDPEAAGIYSDESGDPRRRGSLAVVEVLIAQLGRELATRRELATTG